MSSKKTPSAEHEGSEVLLTTKTGLDRIDFVQDRDGSVKIVLNDQLLASYCWEAARVEEAVSVYMRMIS